MFLDNKLSQARGRSACAALRHTFIHNANTSKWNHAYIPLPGEKRNVRAPRRLVRNPMFHMKEAKIGGSACVLVLLFSGLVSSSGVLGSPLTDDVATLGSLRENIPEDYKIPIRYVSKDVGGLCWLHLNLFPLEISLKSLALKFGNLSSNRENITIFITMLQGLRFTIDNEELEALMQAFKCHYRSGMWSTRRYFNHVKEVLLTFASTPNLFHCNPPSCPAPTTPPTTPGRDSQEHVIGKAVPSLLVVLVIPCTAMLALLLRTALKRRRCCVGRRPDTTCESTGTNDSETQGDLETSGEAATNDLELCSLNKHYRAQQQDTQGSEVTGL